MAMMFNKRNPIDLTIDDLTRELADTRTRCRQLEELLGIGQNDALPSRNEVIARAETDAAIIRVHAQRIADRILDQAEQQAHEILRSGRPPRPVPDDYPDRAPRPDVQDRRSMPAYPEAVPARDVHNLREPQPVHDYPERLTAHDYPERLTAHDYPERLTAHDYPERLTAHDYTERLTAQDVYDRRPAREYAERDYPERLAAQSVYDRRPTPDYAERDYDRMSVRDYPSRSATNGYDERPGRYATPSRANVQIQSGSMNEPWAGRDQVADLWDIAPDDLDASIDRFLSTAIERSSKDLLLDS